MTTRYEAIEAALRDLCRAYVNTLEAGYDRIKSLGGACDSVTMMEAQDPALRAARAALAMPEVKPNYYNQVESDHLNRYTVQRHDLGFWPYCVKAGTGSAPIYIGNKADCERVARSLQCAFLDGAYAYEQAMLHVDSNQFADLSAPGMIGDEL